MTEQPREPGLYAGIPEADYHASHTHTSKSRLDRIAPEQGGSPAHYRAALEHPKEPTAAMNLGTALHCALLEPTRYAEQYVDTGVDDRRAKAFKEAKEAVGDRALKSSEAQWVAGMQAAVWERDDAHASAARRLLSTEGETELSAYAADPATGVAVRCRFDLLAGVSLASGTPEQTAERVIAADVKKTRDATPRGFARSVWQYRYHVQAALYSDIYYWITGQPLAGYTIIAIEEAPPHAVQVFAISDEDMQTGRELYQRDLSLLAQCLERDEWPLIPHWLDEGWPSAYAATPSVLSLEPWMRERTAGFLVNNETDYEQE